MTTPTPVVPSKSKAWVGLIGSLLTLAIPYLLQMATNLPEPWPAVVGAVMALLTGLGIYKAPYKPVDTALVNTTPIILTPQAPPPPLEQLPPWQAPTVVAQPIEQPLPTSGDSVVDDIIAAKQAKHRADQ